MANVTAEQAEDAIRVLESPDPNSRSPDWEGRRIERVDGGYKLLNYFKYRGIKSVEHRQEYMASYMRKRRGADDSCKVNVNTSRRGVLTRSSKSEAWRDKRKVLAASATGLIAVCSLPDTIKEALLQYAQMREAVAVGGESWRGTKAWTIENASSLLNQTRSQIEAKRPLKDIADKILSASTGGYASVKFDRFYA
jgi:hypothetical protein